MRKIAWEHWVDFDFESPKNEDSDLEIYPIMIRTPIGQYSPYEPMCPTNMFDCWICHTNFDLTEEDVELLDQIPGIEVLKVMTRYRFFIGIGKLFSLTDIRPLVEQALSVNRVDAVLLNIEREITGKAKWAVGIYEDGSYKVISSDLDDSSFEDKIQELKDTNPQNIVRYDQL